jgi:hypothetical protein
MGLGERGFKITRSLFLTPKSKFEYVNNTWNIYII